MEGSFAKYGKNIYTGPCEALGNLCTWRHTQMNRHQCHECQKNIHLFEPCSFADSEKEDERNCAICEGQKKPKAQVLVPV